MRVSQIIRRPLRCALSHKQPTSQPTSHLVGWSFRSVGSIHSILFRLFFSSFTFQYVCVHACACARTLTNAYFSLSFHSCSLIYFASDNFAAIKKKTWYVQNVWINLFDLIGLLVSNRCTLVCNKFMASNFFFLFCCCCYMYSMWYWCCCCFSICIRCYGITRSSGC